MQTNVPSNVIYEDIEMRWRIMDLFLNMDLGQLKKTVQFMQTLSVSKEEEENEK